MIQLDYKDRRPLYEQVTEKFKELILKGVLLPDEKIPSVRAMAMELSVTPNTIQRAYRELEKGGYIYTVTGRGNFISPDRALLKLDRENKLGALKKAATEARAAGISKEQLLTMIEEIYGGNSHDTD